MKNTYAPNQAASHRQIRIVCDEAHKNGLRAFAVLNVFDLAIGMPGGTYPVGGGAETVEQRDKFIEFLSTASTPDEIVQLWV